MDDNIDGAMGHGDDDAWAGEDIRAALCVSSVVGPMRDGFHAGCELSSHNLVLCE